MAVVDPPVDVPAPGFGTQALPTNSSVSEEHVGTTSAFFVSVNLHMVFSALRLEPSGHLGVKDVYPAVCPTSFKASA
jgi:hypothetical protein